MNKSGVGSIDWTTTRRQLLQRSSAVAAGLALPTSVLAACGGDEDEGASSGEVGGTLNFSSFEGYDLSPVMKDWRNENGVTVAPRFITTPDDIAPRLQGNPDGGIDLVTYDNPRLELYLSLDLIQTIATDDVPNVDNLLSYFQDDPEEWWRSGADEWNGIPWFWSSLGIAYDSRVVKQPLNSYLDALDSAFDGDVVVVDGANDVFATAGKALDLAMDQLTQAEFQEMKDLVSQVLAQSRGIAPTFGDLVTQLSSGEAAIGWGMPGFIAPLADEPSGGAVKFNIPEEGGYTFFDAWCIPTGADNKATALSWINETLEPRINAEACDYLFYAPAVEGAVDLVSDTVRELYPVDSFDQFIEESPFTRMPPYESDEFVTYPEMADAWEELKRTA